MSAALPRLLRFGHVLTGNPATAEDLVQTALTRSWRAWRLRSIDDPQAYVRKVMVNSYASWYRRKARLETATANPAQGVVINDQALRVDDRDAVWRALLTLPPNSAPSSSCATTRNSLKWRSPLSWAPRRGQ